jgi:hypothetical protein
VSVAGAGDVNGDGVPDFIAGAPGEIDYGWSPTHGMVRVYSGADASILHEWQADVVTSSPYTRFGQRVSGGGDVNGDGYDDVLVAAPDEFDYGNLDERARMVLEAVPHIGYLHRGSEKLCENELYSQIVTLFDRMDYVANLNGELTFCMAAESSWLELVIWEVSPPWRAERTAAIFPSTSCRTSSGTLSPRSRKAFSAVYAA